MGPDIDALRMFAEIGLPLAVVALIAAFFTSDKWTIGMAVMVAMLPVFGIHIMFRRPVR